MAEQMPPIAAITALLEYNWADEEHDYEHNPPDEPGQGHHIFERMQEIAAWLDGIRDGQGTSRGRRHSPGWAGSGYEGS